VGWVHTYPTSSWRERNEDYLILCKEGKMTATVKKARVVRTDVTLSRNQIIPVYAGVRVAHALREITVDMDLYEGVRLAQLLEAVYEQGKKDGRREIFERIDTIKTQIPHNNPGHPKRKKGAMKKLRT
jgi:hypothetical protein